MQCSVIPKKGFCPPRGPWPMVTPGLNVFILQSTALLRKSVFLINRKVAQYASLLNDQYFTTIFLTNVRIYVSASSHSKKCPSGIGRRLTSQIIIKVYFKVLFGRSGFFFFCVRIGIHNMNIHNVVHNQIKNTMDFFL